MRNGAPGEGPGERWPRLGSDEAGKGDYFGPLVVAAVAVAGPPEAEALRSAGVTDSKRLGDARCRELSVWIKKSFPHEVVEISPRRYNELYDQMGNLNRILAWAHARAVENLLGSIEREWAGLLPEIVVVVDQFAPVAVLERALFARTRQVRVIQHPRAEAAPEVAAASVLARARFLESLARLGEKWGIKFPKGAAHVLPAARELYTREGEEALRETAKWHFRTTEQLLVEVGQRPCQTAGSSGNSSKRGKPAG